MTTFLTMLVKPFVLLVLLVLAKLVVVGVAALIPASTKQRFAASKVGRVLLKKRGG